MPSYRETTDAAASVSTIYTLSSGQTAGGNFSTSADHDWYRVSLEAGQVYTFSAVGPGSIYLDEMHLRVRNVNGVVLSDEFYSFPGEFDPKINFKATTTGTYYLDVGYNDPSQFEDTNLSYGLSMADGEKPFYDQEMAATALSRYNSTWTTLGTPAIVTWGARTTHSHSTDSNGYPTDFIPLSTEQIVSVKTNLAKYSDIANISFNQVNPDGTTDNATILVSAYSSTDDPAGAYARLPGSAPESGDISLNNVYVSTTTLPEGSYSGYAVLHEIGHAVGLAHPGDYNATFGQQLNYAEHAAFLQDNRQYTIMSYFEESNTGALYHSFPDTLMLYDIFALQQLYGPNMSTRATDSIYGFGSNTGPTYNFAINKTPVFSIWDGGGVDTVNASGFSHNQLIDLHQGAFSSIGGLKANVSIAYNAIIENAIGGSGTDTLSGNDGNNGLNGGPGSDSLLGGAGDDNYYVDNVGDRTIEVNGRGSDKVFSSVSYSIATQFIEYLYLTGSANINASGNNLANDLGGNSGNNVINGGTGADRMIGGAGNDTYYVDNAGDRVGEANAAGTDQIYSSVSYSVANQFVERIALTGSANINVTGNSLNNSFIGNAGANTIDPGVGADAMAGGLGDDIYYVDNINDQTIEANGGGSDKVFSTVSHSIATQFIENIYLTGSGNSDATGNNLANGLVGTAGNNVLSGGLGNDFLIGGAGNDAFVFNTAFGSRNVDTIKDFNVPQDTIWVDNAIFTALAGVGALAASAFHAGAAAHDADDRMIYDSATGALFYDSNGSVEGGAVQFATLSKGLAMTNADFLIV